MIKHAAWAAARAVYTNSAAAYWICFCSNNQYKVEEKLGDGDWRHSSFFLTLSSGFVKGTCMVLDHEALPLTRSWCIFELPQTLLLEKTHTDFHGLLLCTPTGFLNSGDGSLDTAIAAVDKITCLNLEEATASNKQDEDVIKEFVLAQMGSYERMHDFARENVLRIVCQTEDAAIAGCRALRDRLQAARSSRCSSAADHNFDDFRSRPRQPTLPFHSPTSSSRSKSICQNTTRGTTLSEYHIEL